MQFTITTILAFTAIASAATLKRDDGEVVCEHTTTTTGGAGREHMAEGQSYLKSLGANCGAEAGHCSRVSCSNDAAIWLCNETDQDISGIDCPLLADYVDHIYDACQYDTMTIPQVAEGTQRNTDGWQVQVGWNAC